MAYRPPYIELSISGKLKEISNRLGEIVRQCTLCPHMCGVDRTRSKDGKCRSGIQPVVSSFGPHFGEEPPLVGRRGSGTIFFTNCTMRCMFCQNYDISQLGEGQEFSFKELASMMMRLQELGCHNINFVTPTHMVYAVVQALLIAVPMGFSAPLVYNSGGYDSTETLRIVDGVFDIYMPDFKYSDDASAQRLSGIRQYPETAKGAIAEMHRQVGDLAMDGSGIAYRGLLVRHLVLPEGLAGSRGVIDFLAGISKSTYLNVMDQYRPMYRAREHPELGRRSTLEEVDEVVRYARAAGLTRVLH